MFYTSDFGLIEMYRSGLLIRILNLCYIISTDRVNHLTDQTKFTLKFVIFVKYASYFWNFYLVKCLPYLRDVYLIYFHQHTFHASPIWSKNSTGSLVFITFTYYLITRVH